MSKVIMKDGIYVEVDDDYTAEEELYVDDITHKEGKKQPKYLRTKENPLPQWLAVPTSKSYLSSLSFDEIQNSPRLLRMKDTVKISFDRDKGEFLLNGLSYQELHNQIDSVQETEIADMDMNILLYLYTLIGAQYADGFKKNYFNRQSLMNYEMPYYDIKVNIHDLLDIMGATTNWSEDKINEFLERIMKFEKVIGIIPYASTDKKDYHHIDMSPALVWQGYNSDTNELSFYSPYLTRLIYNLMCDAQGIDPNARPIIENLEKYKLLKPINHYLNKPSLILERNKRAVEIVKVVTMTIATAGINCRDPHLSAYTIIQRIPELTDAINTAKRTQNVNTILERTFSKAWELLRTQTWLDEKYIDFQFPDINDVPRKSELKAKVWIFSHKGLRDKNDIIIAPGNDDDDEK